MIQQLMDGDELQALEAALDFLDDCDGGVGGFLSDPSTDDSGSRMPVSSAARLSADGAEILHIKAKLAIPGRNRSRDLQKQELLELRVEVSRLQERVDELRSSARAVYSEKDYTSRAKKVPGALTGCAGEVLLDAWRDTGKTLRFATRYYVHSCFNADDSALVAMERLHGGLGQLYADTDRALLTNGLGALTSPCSLTNLSPLTNTPSRVEVLFSRIIPFDFKAVGDSSWHEMTKNYVENAVERRQSPRESKATAISQAFTMELEEEGSPVKIQFRYAGKRVVDNHRQVVVLSGQSQLLEAFGAVVSGVHFQEKHWLVLSEFSPGVTMVKVCMSMFVHFDCELPNRQQFVDRTCQMLAKQKQMGFESVLQGVEQSLLAGYPS
ncbi:hypothetical protein PC122_g17076 [Phytophthora cactorum]|nr:hypothetical protein PC122_g17076 [Phytophthora cactorum]